MSSAMIEGGYWEAEEFEDLVTRSLVAMYERDVYQEPPPKTKARDGYVRTLPSWRKATRGDWRRAREVGPYFPPNDRLMLEDRYWSDVDGIPDIAVLALNATRRMPDQLSGYLEVYLAKRIAQLPSRCVLLPARYIAKYRVTSFYPPNSGGVEGYAFHCGLLRDGRIVLEEGCTRDVARQTMISATLNYYADRKFLWNVQAFEAEARATFGVYEDQVKSLFYARDIPLTVTGRRRPILHWVSAHRRRMLYGTECDVTKHLRGITEFEMHGTIFRITRPMKEST
jgi:hypothetical protein